MAAILSESVRALLDGKNFGVLATVNSKGVPSQVLVWYMRSGDEILVSSQVDAYKVSNIGHTGWATLAVSEGPSFVSVRGRATIESDPESVQATLEQIVHRYLEPEVAANWLVNAAATAATRIILHIPIDHVVGQ